jgi:hypothetical protein
MFVKIRSLAAVNFVCAKVLILYLFTSVNPLTAGMGQIGPGYFLNCPYKKPVNLKILKKYVFLRKCISYHLSLGDCLEKSCFHVVLGAFLGLIQKISSVFVY